MRKRAPRRLPMRKDAISREIARMRTAAVLLRHLDELDVLAQQRIDEGGEVHALGVGEVREAVLHFGLEIYRQLQGGPGSVELAALGAGEVDLGGHLIIGICAAHGFHPRGSSSYC